MDINRYPLQVHVWPDHDTLVLVDELPFRLPIRSRLTTNYDVISVLLNCPQVPKSVVPFSIRVTGELSVQCHTRRG